MFQNLRQAMTWLHTWFGLLLGFVLIVVFFFGSLSVFDREIDRWAVPASRFAPQPMPSFDRVLRPVFESMQPSPQSIEQMRSRVNRPMPEHFDVVRLERFELRAALGRGVTVGGQEIDRLLVRLHAADVIV